MIIFFLFTVECLQRRSALSFRPRSSEHASDLINKRHDNDPIYVERRTRSRGLKLTGMMGGLSARAEMLGTN